jgi:DNA-binding FadR family transcriptional regulator
MDRIRPARRLGDDLYRSLAALIERRELPEGARLPGELALAEHFGVSRPTVRETLARMRDDGLIASRRGSGSFVTRKGAVAADLANATVPAAFPAYRAIDSFTEIKQHYVFRRAVEGDAAFVAAEFRSDAQLAAIARAIGRLDGVIAERSVGADADFQFHLSVAVASGNSWFVATLEAMRVQIELTIDIARRLSLGKSHEHLVDVQGEHIAIHDAIRRRDAEEARASMRDHLDKTCDRIFRGTNF